jgi:hypothetical protein
VHILTHRLAGIIFRTESDVGIPSLQSKLFQCFLTQADENCSEADVYASICGINNESLTMPPLSKKERDRISRCQCHPGLLNVPPLRSPIIRQRIEECLSQTPEQLGLDLHIFRVILLDYLHLKADIFYTPEYRNVFLSNGEIGYRLLFAGFLPAFSAVMVHAGGVIINGRAALFLAQDEGGKTTVVKSSKQGTVLCDDQIILRKEGRVIFAHGTPWGKIVNSNECAPVKGLFLLEKAEKFELIRLRPKDAIEHFWKEHFFYRAFLPNNLRIKAFETICGVCQQAPVYRMRFAKDFVDWNAIDAAMEE